MISELSIWKQSERYKSNEILCDYDNKYIMNYATFDTLKKSAPVPEWLKRIRKKTVCSMNV